MIPRRYLTPFMIIALNAGTAQCKSCSAWESKKSIDGSSMTFRLDPYSWRVRADLNGDITIENSSTRSTCKTRLNDVLAVYLGRNNLIYLRVSDISTDELFTLDGRSCREAQKVRQLDLKSEASSLRILQSIGICSPTRRNRNLR